MAEDGLENGRRADRVAKDCGGKAMPTYAGGLSGLHLEASEEVVGVHAGRCGLEDGIEVFTD